MSGANFAGGRGAGVNGCVWMLARAVLESCTGRERVGFVSESCVGGGTRTSVRGHFLNELQPTSFLFVRLR